MKKKMCRVIASTLGITLIWWKSQKLFLRFQIKMYFCVWNHNTSFNSILSIWIFLICYYFRKHLCAYIFWNSLERWKSICYAAWKWCLYKYILNLNQKRTFHLTPSRKAEKKALNMRKRLNLNSFVKRQSLMDGPIFAAQRKQKDASGIPWFGASKLTEVLIK